MKLKYLIVLALLHNIQAWALGEVNSKGPFSVSTMDGISCALDVEGVKCWGQAYDNQLDVPTLKSPMQVSVGAFHVCALDAEGVKCWGNNQFGQSKVPELKSPIQVSAGTRHTCALDAEGLKCWGNKPSFDHAPALKSPIQVSAGEYHTCALDAEGVKCWGDNSDEQLNVPELKFPTQISAGASHTCALDAEGVKCWGSNFEGKTDVPDLKSPVQVSAGYQHSCALDAKGVRCWGRGYIWGQNYSEDPYIPGLKSPQQVSAGGTHTCVLDIEGVKCWKNTNWDPIDVPEMNFDFIGSTIPYLTSARAEYLKTISDIKYEPKLETEYLKYKLISPTFLSLDSNYFLETYLPKFNRQVETFQSFLHYSGDINEVRDAEIHRKFAILSIQSALSVGLSFISQNQQASLKESIRAAGTALTKPMNNQKIKDLVKQIDALVVEKQKLESSSKSAFLVDSLELATNYLREKAK